MGNLPFAIIMFIAIITGPFAVWAMDKVFKPNKSRVRATLFMGSGAVYPVRLL